jgi:hypothetical protein
MDTAGLGIIMFHFNPNVHIVTSCIVVTWKADIDVIFAKQTVNT